MYLETYGNASGKIRYVNENGNLWFVTADLAKMLNMSSSQIPAVLKKLDEHRYKTLYVYPDENNSIRQLRFLSESGVILFISASPATEAEKFVAREFYMTSIPHIKEEAAAKPRQPEQAEIVEPEEEQEEVTEQTSNGLSVFSSPEFGSIRVQEIDGEPWFVGKDVAEKLGYTNPTKALDDHVDNEDRSFNDSLKLSRQSGAWLINESGLYSLVLSSKLPKAKQFKRWITHEVIPSIRKHGGYLTPEKVEEVLLNPDTLIKLATQIKTEQEKNRLLTAKNDELTEQNHTMKPKADYCDEVLRAENTWTATQIAADYHMTAAGFNHLLHNLGIQKKAGKAWAICAAYDGKGYTKTRTYTHIVGGENIVSSQLRWTQKGRLFLYNYLKEKGFVVSQKELVDYPMPEIKNTKRNK